MTRQIVVASLYSSEGATFGTSEVQSLTITGSPTGGTFTLTFGGMTTSAIAHNASAGTVQTALLALPSIDTAGVSCGGGPLPGSPVSIAFGGRLARQNVATITSTSSLTGGTSPAISITTTTPPVEAPVLVGTINGIPFSIESLRDLLTPAGTIRMTSKATADPGWLLMNQTITNGQTLYPNLWLAIPASWQSGSSIVLPSMVDKAAMGAGTTSLGATGGANSRTIASGNLPLHTHTFAHTHGLSTAAAHRHGYTGGAGGNANGVMLTASGPSSFTLGNGGTIQAYGTYDSEIGDGGAHSHTTDSQSASTTSDGGFANTALTTTPLHLAVNFQIKAH